MKLLVHLFLMRLFPAIIVVNASALLGLNYVFPDPDSRFIALVAWCTFTMGFVAVSCIYRNVGSTYFRQLFTKELEDMTLPYLAPQMQNEVRQVLNSHSAISRLAYDAIQLRVGALLFSCASVIPFLQGFQIGSPRNFAVGIGIVKHKIAKGKILHHKIAQFNRHGFGVFVDETYTQVVCHCLVFGIRRLQYKRQEIRFGANMVQQPETGF